VGLFEAIRSGDLERVQELAAADPHAGLTREDGVSAVLTARYHGRLDMVAVLLPVDGALNVWEAAALGRTARLRELVEGDPALVDLVSPDGFRPLGLAAFFGHEDGVRLLLEHDADVNARGTGAIRTTPLEAAAAAGETAIARVLLDAGADPRSAQPGGFTPLHAAAQNRNRELYDLLVEAGADPTARADDGSTAEWS
jgi:ankyrin repeat protein